MPHHGRSPTVLDLTSSMSLVTDKKDVSTDHFKWSSIKKFLYLAYTFSSSSSNFDIFSKVVENVRIFDYIFFEITIGMTYMCMDFFIKQYTRKCDFNKTLNPLLRGITYGILLQSALWTLLHASDLADSFRFLAASFQTTPSWSRCQRYSINSSCVTSKDVIIRCRDNRITNLNNTSAHINYIKSFSSFDRNVVTTRFFAVALVWICNFFFTTVTDDTLIKVSLFVEMLGSDLEHRICQIAFMWRFLSTIIIMILIMFSTKYTSVAFAQMMDINAPRSYTTSVDHVSYAYGIGFVGVYDFGTMSPYTMIDNAVIIFTIVFTALGFARSYIVRILYLMMSSCVEVEISITPHYLLFAILPLSTEFLNAHRLYIIYIYAHVMVATVAYLSMLTLSMSQLLRSEFRSVKNIYIVGILCFLGFSFSLPITVHGAWRVRRVIAFPKIWLSAVMAGLCVILVNECRLGGTGLLVFDKASTFSSPEVVGLIYGLNVTVLYLGGCKVAVIMWLYGVNRFSTDILFWLGFKPTKFWTTCWMLLPIVLFSFMVHRIYLMVQMTDKAKLVAAAAWFTFTLLIVIIFHIKTITRYLLLNNLVYAFKSSKKYGPPDPDDKLRRRTYNETIRLRRCQHNCNVLDETFDCNHLPLMHKGGKLSSCSEESSSEESLTSIYKASTSKKARDSTAYDFQTHHM